MEGAPQSRPGGARGGAGMESVCLRCLAEELRAADGGRAPLPRAAELGWALRAAAGALEAGRPPVGLRCAAHASPVDALSADLLARCFRFLDGGGIACAARVCKFWNAAQQDPGLWEHKLRACPHGPALDFGVLGKVPGKGACGRDAWRRARALYRDNRQARWDLGWCCPRFDWAGIHVRSLPDGTLESPASKFDWSRVVLREIVSGPRASPAGPTVKNEFGAEEFPEELLLFGAPDPNTNGMDLGVRVAPPVSIGVCEWKVQLRDVLRALSGSRMRPVLGVCLQESAVGGGGTLFVAGDRAASPERRTWMAAQALPPGMSFKAFRSMQDPDSGAGGAPGEARCHLMRCVYLPRRPDRLSVMEGAALWKVRLDCRLRTAQVFAYPVVQHGAFADPYLPRSEVLVAEFSVDPAQYPGLGEETARAAGLHVLGRPAGEADASAGHRPAYSLFMQVPYNVQAELVSMEALPAATTA